MHAPANDGDAPQGFFENDVDAAVHAIRVAMPPEVEPVGVDLVVGDQDQALREVGEQVAFRGFQEFTPDRLVPTYTDDGGCPALSHACGEEAP